MNEQTLKAMEGLYAKIRDLPYQKPDEFKVISTGLKEKRSGGLFYNFITTAKNKFYGISGRMKMWESRILPAFYQFPLQEASKNSPLEVRVSNNFFRSRLTVTDPENRVRVKVWSTKLSSIFSYIFGSMWKVKMYGY